MAIQLERTNTLSGNYDPAQKEYLYTLINSFRLIIADDDPRKNILDEKKFTYTDEKVLEFLNEAVSDINLSPLPQTNYNIFSLYLSAGSNIIAWGGVIIALIHEGLLQLKNQMSYNDSGISASFFDKTTLYQSWYGTLIQQYLQAKKNLKDTVIPNSLNSGFMGIGTDFGAYLGPYWGY